MFKLWMSLLVTLVCKSCKHINVFKIKQIFYYKNINN